MSSTTFESIISQIIADSPSGEITEVWNDLIAIAGPSAKDAILDSIEQYNIENTVPVDIDGKSVIISSYNKEGSKFYDPIDHKLFSVDHLNRKGLDIEPYNSTTLNAVQQTILEGLQNYTSTNFPGNVTLAVYPIVEEPAKVAIIIVSTKYNPSNFWNGDWRSEYIYDSTSKELEGKIDVQAHYYEDGNVRFKSAKEVKVSNLEDVVKAIQEEEENFERNLDSSFSELNEKQFKTLRRKLPITRSKVNWGKAIGSYRLGRDAAQGN
ncbi:hypothetical protein HG537_0A04290 [Torulaspora globosa]|uniref:F-actin-capping protein subunit alpha n=1 Tax=Torulaspora globosa TaxID=48254 RepID=A0A7H9HPF3_9SACH|nr:hypothetical protein HG537_0A04290 [Torulaspora sp. CBS 2947]